MDKKLIFRVSAKMKHTIETDTHQGMLTLPQEAAVLLPNSRALVHIISNLGKGLRECLISSSYVPNTTSCPFSTAAIYKRITTTPHPPPHTQAESITHVTCAASNKELNASN
jgi:hypothetical protein